MGTATQELLSWQGVVCPACHGFLRSERPEAIRCAACGRAYPVRDGLPVLIAGQALYRDGTAQREKS